MTAKGISEINSKINTNLFASKHSSSVFPTILQVALDAMLFVYFIRNNFSSI